jgi:hypothetical protein
MKLKSLALTVVLLASCSQVFAGMKNDDACKQVWMISMEVLKGRIAGQPKNIMQSAGTQLTTDRDSPMRGNKKFATVITNVVNNAYSYKLPKTKDVSVLSKHVINFAKTQESMCLKHLS